MLLVWSKHADGRNQVRQEYLKPLYVAPIENDMLLGLDVLLKYHARVN